MRSLWRLVFCGMAAGACFAAAASARATERRFTYTYESSVVRPGDVEIEPWTTVRFGRDDFFLELDERIEFEVGVLEGLQSAFYLNLGALSRDEVIPVPPPAGTRLRRTETEFQGVSWEWKWRLADPVADPVGFALYLEGGLGPAESDVEGKIIVDRRFGRLLAAANLVGEYEWGYGQAGPVETEIVLEGDLAAAYFVTNRLSVGLEVRSRTAMPAGAPALSALFAGPVVSWSQDKWWATITILPQIVGLAGAGPSGLELSDHERLNARVIFGLHL